MNIAARVRRTYIKKFDINFYELFSDSILYIHGKLLTFTETLCTCTNNDGNVHIVKITMEMYFEVCREINNISLNAEQGFDLTFLRIRKRVREKWLIMIFKLTVGYRFTPVLICSFLFYISLF